MAMTFQLIRRGLLEPTFLVGAGLALVAAIPLSRAPEAWEPQRPEFMRIAQRLREGDNPAYGRAIIKTLRDELAGGQLAEDPATEMQLRLASELMRVGELEEAISLAEGAIERIRNSPRMSVHLPDAVGLRAVMYLRKAEISNCISRHNAQCCVFPLQGGGIHSDREPAMECAKSLMEVLSYKPDDLRYRWLLNLIHMALGDYPEGVPPQFLISPSAFESEGPAPRFVDIAPELGVDTFNLAGGVMVEDFDGDGLLDIVSTSQDPEGPMKYYHNVGDGRFEDRSHASRLDDQFGGLNCVAADYDNDGDVDILVLRGGWMLEWGCIRRSLLRNDGKGVFTDVTRRAGLADPAYPSQAGVWADFDNDGWLDLYIGNEARVELMPGKFDYPSQLFRNNRDGTFTDIAQSAGVSNHRYAKGVSAGDYDNDGDMDIFVSNIGRKRLYRNNGDGTFTDVAPELKIIEPMMRSFPTWFFDYDNDGWLDLFVCGYQAHMADIAADYLGRPHDGVPPSLYHNNGDGTFTDVARQVGLGHPYLAMGSNFGDIDNDGWLDVYLGTGDPELTTLDPGILLRNDGGKRFQDVSAAAGVGHLQKGHGTAFADLDNDGDQDLYHMLGAFFPTDKFSNSLFLNPGTEGTHFITLKLRGVQTNRMAHGARVRVDIETPYGPRQLHRAVGSVSSFGGSPSRQEIGLGDATAITRLEIWWPASGGAQSGGGRRQVFENVPLDSAFSITEGVDRLEPLAYPRIKLVGDPD